MPGEQAPEPENALALVAVCLLLFLILGLGAYAVWLRPIIRNNADKRAEMEQAMAARTRKLAKDDEPQHTLDDDGPRYVVVCEQIVPGPMPAYRIFRPISDTAEYADLGAAKKACTAHHQQHKITTLVHDRHAPLDSPLRLEFTKEP